MCRTAWPSLEPVLCVHNAVCFLCFSVASPLTLDASSDLPCSPRLRLGVELRVNCYQYCASIVVSYCAYTSTQCSNKTACVRGCDVDVACLSPSPNWRLRYPQRNMTFALEAELDNDSPLTKKKIGFLASSEQDDLRLSALRQVRAPMMGLQLVTEGSLQISGRTH
ncbi:hypothetical protein PoB_005637000 [Plakobranchus ocellatus]|uniref:Uncharacterized protein n=1 Tax=Plakobranchus ocellatus TaxID=259542 RepID=A0AAV4CEJ2_9GAST|nr:hypothetical protein PoB_005637000 [Plakobranchus ocellatus]